MNSPRTTLYRDKQNGKLMGVCAGIADYTGINVMWVRIALVVSLMTPLSSITFPGYFIAGFLLNKKPPYLYRDESEQNPKRTAREIRAAFRDVDRRLAAVEHHYVSSNPRLTAEIERLR
jgi:phage shock protein C